jgi:hypothetical protein
VAQVEPAAARDNQAAADQVVHQYYLVAAVAEKRQMSTGLTALQVVAPFASSGVKAELSLRQIQLTNNENN